MIIIKLTCKNFNTDRLLRWRLKLEEYGPDIEYINGGENIVADTLSIFPSNGIKRLHRIPLIKIK